MEIATCFNFIAVFYKPRDTTLSLSMRLYHLLLLYFTANMAVFAGASCYICWLFVLSSVFKYLS